MIEKFDSNLLSLATVPILGQAPRKSIFIALIAVPQAPSWHSPLMVACS